MLLAGDGDGADLAGAARLRQRVADGGPPAARVGLAGTIGAGHDMGGLAARDDLARVGIHQQDLGRLGRAIDPGDEPSTRHVRPFRVTLRARPEASPKGSARTRGGRGRRSEAPVRRRRATGRRWRARAGSGRSRRPAALARGPARSRRPRRSTAPGPAISIPTRFADTSTVARNASPAAVRTAASMPAAVAAGAPSLPMTSHSSGPSHRTWPSPSVAAVTRFGVVGRARSAPARSAPAGRRRSGRPEATPGAACPSRGWRRSVRAVMRQVRRRGARSPGRTARSRRSSPRPRGRPAARGRARRRVRGRPLDERQRERPAERRAAIRRGHVAEHRHRHAREVGIGAPRAARPRGGARPGRTGSSPTSCLRSGRHAVRPAVRAPADEVLASSRRAPAETEVLRASRSRRSPGR